MRARRATASNRLTEGLERMPLRLSTGDTDFEARFAAFLSQKREISADVDAAVAGIIADVRVRGDAALIERLRASFSNDTPSATGKAPITEPSDNAQSLDSPPPAPQTTPKKSALTVRTGWTFTWDVRRSQVIIKEGESGEEWKQSVGELPPNVQDIIAQGGLEKWVGKELAAK